MSKPTELTWDNLDEWVASIPKDQDGHFLPNNRNDITLPLVRKKVSLNKPLLSPKLNEKLSSGTNTDFVNFDSLVADDKTRDIIAQANDFISEDKVQSLLCEDAVFLEYKTYFANLINTGLVLKSRGFVEDDKVAFCTFTNNGTTVTYTLNDGQQELTVNNLGEITLCREQNLSTTRDSWATNPGMGRAYQEPLGENDVVINMHFNDPDKKPEILSKDIDLNEAWYPSEVLPSVPIEVEVTVNKSIINIDQAELDNDPLLRAQRGLASLDVEEAEKEFALQAANMSRVKEMKDNGLLEIVDSPLNNPNLTPEQLRAWAEANVAKASNIVKEMDAYLDAGGRVNVADKFLMNCHADLNQLIPFKYNWAWSFYLTSCEHHWMPGELSLDNAKDDYLKLSNDAKLILARAYLTHLSRKKLMPESVLLNIYRMLTNPECRQYLLRQGQESVMVYHAWMELNEAVSIDKTLIGGLTPAKALGEKDDYLFKLRHALTLKHVQFMHDYTSATETPKDLAEFVKSFIILYTHVNFLIPLISHYQVITTLEFVESCQPIAGLFARMNIDSLSQFEFAKLFVATVAEENPVINTAQWRAEIDQALSDLINIELELVKTKPVAEHDVNDITFIANYFKEEMMRTIDSSYVKDTVNGDHTRGFEFVQILKSLKPKVDYEAGLGGSMQW